MCIWECECGMGMGCCCQVALDDTIEIARILGWYPGWWYLHLQSVMLMLALRVRVKAQYPLNSAH
jgi:hypothetical protein